jgi:hypothetical protein
MARGIADLKAARRLESGERSRLALEPLVGDGDATEGRHPLEGNLTASYSDAFWAFI